MGIQKRQLVKRLYRVNDEMMYILKEMYDLSAQDETVMRKYSEIRKKYCSIYKALKKYDEKYYAETPAKEKSQEPNQEGGENGTEEGN